jgi:HAD superfamily hydrolase (TIGR01509 family)
MSFTPSERPFDVLLFDLGGVLIQLSGVDRMLELTGHILSSDDLWQRWLTSEGVRQFEAGRAGPEEFGAAMLAEFGLEISVAQFLQEFTAWPSGVFPGSFELLEALGASYRLACLTNTNVLHWARVCDEMGLPRYFHASFASHLLGLLKPDVEIFQYVVEQLGCPPERILFLDDNRLNVERARSVGMAAHRVVGLTGVIAQLTALGVLDQKRPTSD